MLCVSDIVGMCVAPGDDFGVMTPYEQEKEYDDARGFDEKARWIVLCNFDEFHLPRLFGGYSTETAFRERCRNRFCVSHVQMG